MNKQINDTELFNAIFNFSDNKYKLNLKILLKVTQPFLYEFKYLNETYLIYVLQDRNAYVNNQVFPIKELLISKVDSISVLKLIESELSIYDSFSSSTSIYRIGQIGNKKYSRKKSEKYQ